MLLATTPSGFWLFGMRYFVLEVRPPAHCLASAHFFSEISRLRLARDRGSGPWVPACPATSLAHSSAFSLPAIPLWPGHHRISMVMPGLARRRAAMCCRARMANFCPRPGSSDAIRRMAACVSEKIVTCSGVVFLCTCYL